MQKEMKAFTGEARGLQLLIPKQKSLPIDLTISFGIPIWIGFIQQFLKIQTNSYL